MKRYKLPRRTVNEAELRGALAAAELATKEIITDSNVVTFWVRAGAGKGRQDLSPIARQIGMLLTKKGLRLEWRPGDEDLAGLAGVWNEENK